MHLEVEVMVQCSLPFFPGLFHNVFVTDLIVQMLTQQKIQKPQKGGCFFPKFTSVTSPDKVTVLGNAPG